MEGKEMTSLPLKALYFKKNSSQSSFQKLGEESMVLLSFL